MEQSRACQAVPADLGQAPAWERMVGLVSLGSASATQARQAQTQTGTVGMARGAGVATRTIGALNLLEQPRAGQAVPAGRRRLHGAL